MATTIEENSNNNKQNCETAKETPYSNSEEEAYGTNNLNLELWKF